MDSLKTKKAVSVFVYKPSKDAWAEYVVIYSYGTKVKKPIKFLSSLVWRSTNKIAFSAGQRGSFFSEREANDFMEKALLKEGSEVKRMTNKSLLELEAKYDYPTGRYPHVLEKAVI